MENKIYAFLYCENIHESSWTPMSLHYSKEGAEIAMGKHKEKTIAEYRELYDNEELPFGYSDDWKIEEFLIQP